MTETDMRRKLKKIGKAGDFSFWPVETHGSTLGMADLLFAGRGSGGVLELKIFHGMAVAMVPFRPGQRGFLKEHARGNPRTFVLGYWPTDGCFYLLGPESGFLQGYTREELCEVFAWCNEELTLDILDVLCGAP